METIKELKEICQPHRKKINRPRDWGYLKHRELSIYITKAILKLTGGKIKPNYISLFNILFGLAVLFSIALCENHLSFFLLLLLFYFGFLLDKVDGEIARYKREITLGGAYLDEIYHLFVQHGLILALAVHYSLMYFGIVGFFLFFLTRYLNKIRYFIYAKYKVGRHEFSIKGELGRTEKLLVDFLNVFPLKACALSRRHDIFLILAIFLAAFFFNSAIVWFWFLLIWVIMLAANVLRFLFLNYLFIDRDIQMVDESKL